LCVFDNRQYICHPYLKIAQCNKDNNNIELPRKTLI
jgi:hypothetical protein